MVFPLLSRFTRPFTHSSILSIVQDSGAALPDGMQRCTLAAGCFWGPEHLYRKHFASKGLIDAKVGYTGGGTADPTYRAICTGDTGHAEAVQLIFDPEKVTYAELLEFFYRMHDPTTANRQGPDRGSQYRSAIFFHDGKQEAIAREVTAKVNEQWYQGRVVTQILPFTKWYSAEEYHQKYLDKNPSGYECPTHILRPFEPLK